MKIKLLKVFFLLNLFNVYSQNQQIISSPPTASALGKYVDNPVSFYNGTPEISIPLYDLKVKDYNLPINLSYHASGIKVEETASNIGLGWVLNAGGVISRVVKDIPDDYVAPYCPNTWDGSGTTPDCRNGLFQHGKNVHDIDIVNAYNQDATNINYSLENVFFKFFRVQLDGVGIVTRTFEKIRDTEPDIFYFNFCGNSGKFVFEVVNGQRKIKILSHHDLKISHLLDVNGRIVKFEVIDTFGNIYKFEDMEYTESLVESRSPYATLNFIEGIAINTYPSDMSQTRFNSTWYLTKIITPESNEINFKYENETIIARNQGAEQTTYDLLSTNYNPNVDFFHYLINLHQTNFIGKRLSGIETRDTKIDFLSDYKREDVRDNLNTAVPKVINGLIIYSKQLDNLKRIKKTTFEQDYFDSPLVTSYVVGGRIYYTDPTGVNAYFKRLRLRSITEFGQTDTDVNPATTFEYKYSGFPGCQNTDRLPHRFSKDQDLWGFYNGANGNKTLIPQLYVYPDMYSDSRRFSVYRRLNHTGNEYVLAGANRLPSEALMDIGSLTKITYPTGGYTKYEYEPHKFRDGNEEFMGGGLRIKKITKNDGYNAVNDIVYNYSYKKTDNTSSGELISIPIFAVCDGYVRGQPINGSYNSYANMTTRFSQPQASLGNTQGYNIGYRMVTESITGNGKTTYEYSMPALWHESNDKISPLTNPNCSIAKNGSCDNLYEATPVYDLFPYSTDRSDAFISSMNPATINSFPFPENPNYDWNRGQLLAKKQYNELGNIVRSEIYDYSIWYLNGQTAPGKVYGIKFGQYWPPRVSKIPGTDFDVGTVFSKCFRVAKYNYLTDVTKVMSSKTITEYYGGNSISIRTDYSHSGLSHTNITKVTQETGNTDKVITTYKYPLDYSFPPVNNIPSTNKVHDIAALVVKNIISTPIEINTSIVRGGVEYMTGGKLNYFENLKLEKTFELEFNGTINKNNFNFSTINPSGFVSDNRYKEKISFPRYDDKGNILEIKLADGITTSYIWGYNNQYPIAKVVNATYQDIINVLGTSTLTNLNDGYKIVPIFQGVPTPIYNKVALTDVEIRTMLSVLQTNLTNAQITIFSYKPLVGITSITDPKGDKIIYTYDAFGRLQFVKDKNDNILSENQYKYKQ